VNTKKGKKRIIAKRIKECINVVCVQNEELLVLALAVNIITTRPQRVKMIALGQRNREGKRIWPRPS
jgi:hypothetical protein